MEERNAIIYFWSFTKVRFVPINIAYAPYFEHSPLWAIRAGDKLGTQVSNSKLEYQAGLPLAHPILAHANSMLDYYWSTIPIVTFGFPKSMEKLFADQEIQGIHKRDFWVDLTITGYRPDDFGVKYATSYELSWGQLEDLSKETNTLRVEE